MDSSRIQNETEIRDVYHQRIRRDRDSARPLNGRDERCTQWPSDWPVERHKARCLSGTKKWMLNNHSGINSMRADRLAIVANQN